MYTTTSNAQTIERRYLQSFGQFNLTSASAWLGSRCWLECPPFAAAKLLAGAKTATRRNLPERAARVIFGHVDWTVAATGRGGGDDEDERRRQRPVARGWSSAAGRRVRGGAADGMRSRKSLHRSPAAEGDRPTAPAADGHSLFGGDGQRRVDQCRQAGCARARLRAGDQVPGRHRRKKGYAVIRNRAGALQGSARTGASRGRGRQGDAGQCRSRIHASAGTQSKDVSTQANLDRARAARDT